MSLLVGVLLLAGGPAATAQEDCVPNRLIGGQSGVLTVTERRVVRDLPNNCPLPRRDLGTTFVYPQGRSVFVWFRLEGDMQFLEAVRPSDRFTAELWKIGDAFSSNETLTLGNDRLNVVAAAGEAAGNDAKRFDWRFNVHFSIPVRPGEYRLRLFHAGRQICALEDACGLVLTVSP